MLATSRKITSNLHYACTALLAIWAVPQVQRLHLPSHLDWHGNIAFYLNVGSQSLLYAMVFCALAFPLRESFGVFWARYRNEKLRIAFVCLFFLFLCRMLPLTSATLSTAKTLFLIELGERTKSEGVSFLKRMMSILVPAVYMFLGLTLVITYNDIIVASRFPLSCDGLTHRIDASILWGQSISSIAHALWTILPARFLAFLDVAYFQMFAVVGAGLLVSAYASYKRGMQFVGACLTAYYLALLIFYIWPTYGPYVFCSTHAAQFPPYLKAYSFQASGMRSLQAVSQHKTKYLASGYYIAFPALHVGLPVITMGMMRRWRKVFWLLAVYNCIVVFAIVALEWHYAIDLLGGAAVGVLSLAIVGGGPAWHSAQGYFTNAKLNKGKEGAAQNQATPGDTTRLDPQLR